jgi:hypothetical protein
MTATQRATQILATVTQPFTSFPDRLNEWLGKFPSTNGRIVATIIAMMGTAIRYWMEAGGPSQWEPSMVWLAFLATMAGIDTAQFNVKRKTQQTPTQKGPE